MAKTPDTLIPVADAPGHAAAHAMASALRDAGLQAFVFDTARTTLQWESPAVINPWQVHVRRADAERAAEILRNNRDESIDIDWEEVDVGAPEDATAAKLATQHTAPWLGDASTRRHPLRDAAFAIAKLGIVGWILGITLLGVVTAVLIVLKII
ncbi:MAG: hypothetical protein AAFR76_05295 [Planctomycetota bacterium]